MAVPIIFSSKMAGILKPSRGLDSANNDDQGQGQGVKGQGQILNIDHFYLDHWQFQSDCLQTQQL
jgi:hypothetical protein